MFRDGIRTMMIWKKTFLIVLMTFVPVCFVIMKRKELYESSGYVSDSLANKRAYWEDCAFGNGRTRLTLSLDKYRRKRKTFNVSEVYVDEENLFVELKDIKKSLKNIFFVESKCATEKLSSENLNVGDFVLNARQSCAVESSSRTNPDREVYILHTCPLRYGFLQRAPLYGQQLLRRPNVHLVRYNRKEVFEGSPVEQLVTKGGAENSLFPVEHASDILRFTLLWRFGGVYCDTDVITIRSLADLGTNFCGMESTTTIGSAILAFEPAGFGHELLTNILAYINDHFDGSQWASNGPDVITNFILKACNATIDTASNCPVFSVFNHSVLYPVFWWDAEDLFSADLGPALVTCVSRSAYLVHVWNKLTSKAAVQVGSDQAYGLLANRFCPDVYANCGDTF